MAPGMSKSASTQASQSVFPGVNGKIAFHSTRDGNSEIYTMNADGSAQTNTTNNPANDAAAAWSPDASTIAFYSDRNGNLDIYVMNADGSGVVNLTNNAASETSPAWSPDGTKIAFISTRDGNQEIYVMNTDGSNPTRLTTTPLVREYPPTWSPDGTRIAFWSDEVGNFQVFVMNADGTNVTRLTQTTGDAYDPGWSPDNAKLAFWTTGNVWVMNADGTNPVNLTNGVGDNAEPAYSPDGTSIAFVSNRMGNYGICTMNSDGTGVSCLTTGTDGGPDWARSFYPFAGFYQPVDNPNTVNSVKAGSAVPVKFSLGSDLGLNILKPGSPTSAAYPCGSGPTDVIEQTVTAGNSSLTYDPLANQYVYVWKTDKKWAGTCRRFELGLNDGSTHTALFSFK